MCQIYETKVTHPEKPTSLSSEIGLTGLANKNTWTGHPVMDILTLTKYSCISVLHISLAFCIAAGNPILKAYETL